MIVFETLTVHFEVYFVNRILRQSSRLRGVIVARIRHTIGATAAAVAERAAKREWQLGLVLFESSAAKSHRARTSAAPAPALCESASPVIPVPTVAPAVQCPATHLCIKLDGRAASVRAGAIMATDAAVNVWFCSNRVRLGWQRPGLFAKPVCTKL